MRGKLTVLAALLIAVGLVVPGWAAQPHAWGTVLGRIVVDGDPPPLRVVAKRGPQQRMAPPPDNPAGVPLPVHIVEDSLLLGEQGELANAFVYLRSKPTRVHPADEKLAPRKIEFVAGEQRFEPHSLLARRGDTLVLKNKGKDPLNIKMHGNSEFNILVPVETSKDWTLKEADSLPQQIDSNILQWLRGVLLVRDNSYADITNTRGLFVIANLPLGEPLDLQLWHERAGYLRNITSTTGHKTSPVGQVRLTLTDAVTDLGEFPVPAELFKE